MTRYKFLTSILASFGLLMASSFLSPNALAADLTVTCTNEGPCSTSPGGNAALFNQTNWAPGDTVTQTITVINQDTDDDCDLTLDTKNETQTPTDFATKLFTVIKQGASDLFGVRDGTDKATNDKTLDDLFGSGPISLGVVGADSTTEYLWTVTFDLDTNNTYQGAEAEFAFDMVFECGTPPAPAPLGAASVGGPPGPPVCTTTAPASAPTLSAVQTSPNTVLLNWTAVSPVTHYTIVYGTSPGNPIYGNPNVDNVLSYSVSGLSAGTTYYFQVAGVNDCAPGPFSNEASATPTGASLPLGPAPGFAVLGEATPPAELVKEGVVAGAMCVDKPYLWWLPLVIQAVLVGLYFWFIWKKNWSLWWSVPLVLAILSQIIHEIFGCNCATGRLCPWYWVFNLIILLLSAGIYKYFQRRRVSSA